MLNGHLNRRSFLRASTGFVLAGSAAGLLAACATPAPGAATAPTAAVGVNATPAAASSGAAGIKVGVLNSLSGTMAISEVAVKNATLMAIDERNGGGGVLSNQMVRGGGDGASGWPSLPE